MKNVCFATLFFLAYALTSFAQDADITTRADAPTTATTSIYIARTGEYLEQPYTGTYHLFEFLQVRGKWIYPDLGEVDFSHGNYRELFIGGGRTLYDSKKITLMEELYFVQATGPAAKSARYLWPWTLVDIRFTPKLTSETVYFPYVPLNSSATMQHVIERAKIEYAFNNTWKLGGGYGGYKSGNDQWQNKPLITTTVSTRAGAFEFWLQKMPGHGAQVQVRYSLAHTSKH